MEVYQRCGASSRLDLDRTPIAALVVRRHPDVQWHVDDVRGVGVRLITRPDVDRARARSGRVEADPLQRQLLRDTLGPRLLTEHFDRHRPVRVLATESVKETDPLLVRNLVRLHGRPPVEIPLAARNGHACACVGSETRSKTSPLSRSSRFRTARSPSDTMPT